jgi:hypothetical protein
MKIKRMSTIFCAMVIGAALVCTPVWAMAPLSEPPANQTTEAAEADDQGDGAVDEAPTNPGDQPPAMVAPDPPQKPKIVIEETGGQ